MSYTQHDRPCGVTLTSDSAGFYIYFTGVDEIMMFGFAARQFRPYEQEVEFARMNGFEFLQIWYDKNGIFSGFSRKRILETLSCGG